MKEIKVSAIFKGREYWVVVREVLDPKTGEVVELQSVAEVDNKELKDGLLEIIETTNQDPNNRFYLHHITGSNNSI